MQHSTKITGISVAAAFWLFPTSFMHFARAMDIPFDQDISFRSTYSDSTLIADWDRLPFSSFDNAQSVINIVRSIEDEAVASCFVALSDQSLFAARRKEANVRDKLHLETPYYPWQSLYALGSGANMLLNSLSDSYSFFVLKDHNIVGFEFGPSPPSVDTLSGSCGEITRKDNILAEDVDWLKPLAVASSTEFIWVATLHQGLQQVSIADGSVSQVPLKDESVTAMTYVPAWKQLFVGTQSALYTFQVTGAEEGLGRKAHTELVYHEWITGVLDTPPQQFAFDAVQDSLWLAESGAVHRLDRLGRWWRYGYHQGAPMGNITSVAVTASGYVWVGSQQGLARFRPDEVSTAQDDTLEPGTKSDVQVISSTGLPSSGFDPVAPAALGADKETAGAVPVLQDPWDWLYFGSQRYIPDPAVLTLISADAAVAGAADRGGGSEGDAALKGAESTVVLVATASGVALLETAPWKLSEKATAFAKFQYPRHDRNKLTTDCGLNRFGDTRSFYKKVGDNDGLWTAMHAMGEAYAYASTGSEEARSVAWRAFEGLEMLLNVTGAYPHFPARSYCFPDSGTHGCGDADGADRWHESNTVPGALWKDDTSSDEIDGHLAALPLIYDFVAQGDEEKTRVYKAIDGITGGILKNDLYLIDPTTGQPTTWGFWNPEQVNFNPDHYSERGANSVGILGYLASAYSITRDRAYVEAFRDLADNHGYVRNALNVKIDNPDDDNHSDNELITLSYHILFYSWQRISETHEPEFKAEMWELVSPLLPSVERTWQLIGTEYSPLWTAVAAGVAQLPASPSSLSNSAWSLRHWALDLIDWPIDNTQRWDVAKMPDAFTVRDNDTPITRPIRPPQERTSSHWNSDPFAITAGGGHSEYEPAIWRLPYYMMLFYKLL